MNNLDENFQNIANSIRESNSEITAKMTPAQMSSAIINSASRVLYEYILTGKTSLNAGTYSVADKVTALKATDLAGATKVGPNIFRSWGLTSVVLPESVTSIGSYAFSGCSKLTGLGLGKASQAIKIGEAAFLKDEALKKVTIRGNVSIGQYAFANCTSLKTVCFIDGDSGDIGDHAFQGCSELQELWFDSAQITSIGTEAFKNCPGITTLHLPASLTYLGPQAFGNITSTDRKTLTVYCPAITPPSTNGDIPSWFSYTSSLTIYVPTESVETYKTAQGWKKYATKILAYNFDANN